MSLAIITEEDEEKGRESNVNTYHIPYIGFLTTDC